MSAVVNIPLVKVGVMYPMEVSASASIPIPKCRRRYNYSSPLSCSPVVDGLTPPSTLVKGYAHLCFSEDGTWFEGHLTTNDESQYGLVGKLRKANPHSSGLMEEDNKSPVLDQIEETHANSFSSYQVTVIDHDDEQTYEFPSVLLASCQPLCALISSRFNFNGDKAYRGQRADMLIQQYLSPRLVGNNLRVYAGILTLDLLQESSGDALRKTGNPLWG